MDCANPVHQRPATELVRRGDEAFGACTDCATRAALVDGVTRQPLPVDIVECGANLCGGIARVVAHWPSGPIAYCRSCAEWMQVVARAMGVHVHEDPIALPPVPGGDRLITVED